MWKTKNKANTNPPQFLVERSQTMYNKDMEKLHIPVLLSEVLAGLAPQAGESYLDLTAGYGGHAAKILGVTRNYKNSTLVDRDEFAVNYLKRELPSEVEIVRSDFYSAVLQFLQCGRTYDMVLADFGVSSPQLDLSERGFSFTKDGPLDMRMDQSQTLTANAIVNHWSERELVRIFTDYGEESPGRAQMLARAIVEHRPVQSTSELAEIILAKSRSSRTHPAARIFQAIRIAVNDELTEIERTLPLLPRLLNPGGRLAIITFHSLEDRLVKHFMSEAASHGEESVLTILTKKPIVAGDMELVINPRARSAKLRVAKRN